MGIIRAYPPHYKITSPVVKIQVSMEGIYAWQLEITLNSMFLLLALFTAKKCTGKRHRSGAL